MKRLSADGSVGSPHVRVGHRQASNPKNALQISAGRFFISDFFDFNHVYLSLVFLGFMSAIKTVDFVGALCLDAFTFSHLIYKVLMPC